MGKTGRLYSPEWVCSVSRDSLTLQVPHLPVRFQYEALAALRKIPELDPAPQLPVRRTATVDRIAPGTERVLAHAHVEVLARLLEREKTSEDRRITFGGHAAVIVESDVVRYSAR